MNDSDTRRSWPFDRVALVIITVMMLPAGLQGAFAPRSFFDDFPMGRSWISGSGDADNQHLIRDVGALFLALVIITGWTVLRRGRTEPLAVGWLVFGLVHATFHGGRLDGFETADQIGIVMSTGAVPVLAALALWSARERRCP